MDLRHPALVSYTRVYETRLSHDHLIFNMGIPIPGKMVFILAQPPCLSAYHNGEGNHLPAQTVIMCHSRPIRKLHNYCKPHLKFPIHLGLRQTPPFPTDKYSKGIKNSCGHVEFEWSANEKSMEISDEWLRCWFPGHMGLHYLQMS